MLALLDPVAADPRHLDAGGVADDRSRSRSAPRRTAPIVTTAAARPRPSGSSASRAASFLASVRAAIASSRVGQLGSGARSSAPCACGARRAFARGRPSRRRLDLGSARGAAQLARRGLGIGRVADRAHDDDPPRAGGDDLADVGRVDAADREPGVVAAGCAAACSIRLEPGGRPARLGRRLPDRAGAELVGPGAPRAASAASNCSRRVGREPDQRRGPGRARASATGSSSWPTWTPSASHASTRPGSSLRKKSAPCSRAARANGSANAISSSAQRGAFSRSWITSTPPAIAAASSCRRVCARRAAPRRRSRGAPRASARRRASSRASS